MVKKSSSKALRVTAIKLENWRNFREVELDLQRRVFLVGPNASGKSNFLDVFRFLRNIVAGSGGFKEAVRKRDGVSRLRCLAARRYPDLLINVRVGPEEEAETWEYTLRFSQDNRQRPVIKKEMVIKNDETILERPDGHDQLDPERLTQTHLEQVSANQKFRELVDFFGSIRYLHIVPQLVREPDRSIGKQHDPYGGDFIEQIARTPEKTQSSRLRRIVKALCVALPQLSEIKLHTDVRGTPHLLGKYEHWRRSGAWQSEEQFSDGTLRLMGLLWALLDGSGPLLLEEPELSLHPEVVRFLPQMFARIQGDTGRQIILSTHSADLLTDGGIGLDEVLLFLPQSEGTAIRPASAIREIKDLLAGGLHLGEAVMPRTRPELAEQLSLSLAPKSPWPRLVSL